MDNENMYSYVPVDVIEALIEKHGGIDENAIKQYAESKGTL